ncbi:MAG: hypothetical protein M3O50_11170 [Myxococcota bacterium]|nr:hypothetical protein [Myxococcota bacterium]
MTRRLTAIGTAIGVWLVASQADAQVRGKDFGDKGAFIFSADRLVPLLSYERLSQDDLQTPNQTTTTTQPAISILWGTTSPTSLFFTVPRVGFDYTFAPNWTVGGDGVIFFTLGGGTDTENRPAGGASTTRSLSGPSTTLFGIAPRVGYIFEFNDVWSLWLRAGASFYTTSTKFNLTDNNTTTSSANQFALDLDPQFVIAPVKHFAFTAGLTVDVPITGRHWQDTTTANNTTTVSASSSMLFVGGTAGILGWF